MNQLLIIGLNRQVAGLSLAPIDPDLTEEGDGVVVGMDGDMDKVPTDKNKDTSQQHPPAYTREITTTTDDMYGNGNSPSQDREDYDTTIEIALDDVLGGIGDGVWTTSNPINATNKSRSPSPPRDPALQRNELLGGIMDWQIDHQDENEELSQNS